MSVPIIIFYHCCFWVDGRSRSPTTEIVKSQLELLKSSGLENSATEINVGINEMPNKSIAAMFPPKCNLTFHGNQCRNELRTLLMIEDWCAKNSGEAYILYLHAKGATHDTNSEYAVRMVTPWRNRMMEHCVTQWRRCVLDLRTHEAVGCHWLTGQGWDKSQHYFAGNFYWVRASFFRTIPSITTRQRIKDYGIDALESRYESEVHLGNGPQLPKIKNYYAGPIGT